MKITITGYPSSVEFMVKLLSAKGYKVIATTSFPYATIAELAFAIFAGYNRVPIQEWSRYIARCTDLPLLFVFDPEGPAMPIHGAISLDCDGLTLMKTLHEIARRET